MEVGLSNGKGDTMSSEPKKCIVCDAVVEDGGWQHPDKTTQDFFEETGSEFLLGTNKEAAACSEGCWHYFMEESFGDWQP